MDCDRTFAVLTAAPFPTGAHSDAAVERHLLICAECRAIADALRPLEATSHESLPAPQRKTLPQYGSQRSVKRVVAQLNEAADPWTGVASQLGGFASSDQRWRSERDLSAPPQVAAFTLAPRNPNRPLQDALCLLAMVAAFAIGGWGLGWLTM